MAMLNSAMVDTSLGSACRTVAPAALRSCTVMLNVNQWPALGIIQTCSRRFN